MFPLALRQTFLTAALLVGCDGVLNCCRGSGLYWGKPVNRLTSDEAISMCEGLHMMQGPDELCEAIAAQRTHNPDHCAIIEAKCIQEGPPKESCYSEAFAVALSSCEDDVTVGFFERCFKEQIRTANALSCDDPPGRELIPAPCFLDLADKCEDMFGE